jgi:hypothetical protein
MVPRTNLNERFFALRCEVCLETLVNLWEIFPWVALQAVSPFFELDDLKDRAIGQFEVGPA